MSKFKCTENSRDFVEVLRDKEGRPALTVGDNHSASVAVFAPSDAPALALAILEEANYDMGSEVALAVEYLERYTRSVAEKQAEDEAQAELEAEALELENAGRDAAGADRIEELSEMGRAGREFILAVARRARELAEKRAEK